MIPDPPAPRIWKQGERCRIRFNGRTVDGRIHFGSPNGVSLMLMFEAVLFSASGGGYAGQMAVMWEGDGFFDLIERELVEILEPAN